MQIHSQSTQPCTSELDRLGDEIAELSAHLDAATARLLELIRDFDARGGWNTGFASCAAWLSWRAGLDLGAARERVRVARARDSAALGRSPGPRGALLCQGARPHPRGHAGDRSATVGGRARGHRRPRGADRAGLALRGSTCRSAGGEATACDPRPARVSGRGRHGGAPGTARAGDGGAGHGSPGRRPREPVPTGPGAGPGLIRVRGRFRGNAHRGTTAGGCPGPARGDGPAPGPRSRPPGGTLPGGSPRRRPGAGRSGAAWPVGPGRGYARFRGNVPTPRVRRQPGGDAP